jgi:hypothetical protein
MPKSFAAVLLIVAIFLGYLIGYSIPPFLHAGVFSGREEKGVAVEIDEDMEKYYEQLYQQDEDE